MTKVGNYYAGPYGATVKGQTCEQLESVRTYSIIDPYLLSIMADVCQEHNLVDLHAVPNIDHHRILEAHNSIDLRVLCRHYR